MYNVFLLIYFIESEEAKLDWMSTINASVEGSPREIRKHAKSFRQRYNRIVRVCSQPYTQLDNYGKMGGGGGLCVFQYKLPYTF